MPRTYRDLTGKQDVIILSDANRNFFSDHVLKWFLDGVVDEGMGLLMTGGRESFGAYYEMPDWTPTLVGDILPVEATKYIKGPTAKVKILKPDHRFIASLPWSKIGMYGIFFGYNPVSEREGSQLLADLVIQGGPRNPFLVWWDVGNGRTFAMTSDWTPAMADAFVDWEFYQDFATNLMLFLSEQPIPPNPLIVHGVRFRLNDYFLERDFVISMIEFVNRFGANPSRVEKILGEADSRLAEVDALYMNYDFEGALSIVESLMVELDRANNLAIKIKDEALFWIYIVEWLTVLGTAMVAGVMVWGLMMRRFLYKSVDTTRGKERGGR
jgi:uncharacterized membrane protein